MLSASKGTTQTTRWSKPNPLSFKELPMAANLATNRLGNAMIASYRDLPWHGQGHLFTEPVSGIEMLKAAGLDFQVLACPLIGRVRVEIPNDANRTLSTSLVDMAVDGMQGIYRSDTGAILGTSSEKYNIFQNQEMVEVIDQIAGTAGMTYEVCGALGNGSRVWVLAHIPDLSYNVKGDAMKQYILITTSHDGSSALSIFPTFVRVCCQNTMRACNAARKVVEAKEGKENLKSGYTIKHTRNMKQMVNDAANAFASAVEVNKFSREMHAALAEVPATPAMKDEFFGFIVDGAKDETEKAKEISLRTAARRAAKRAELNSLLLAPTNQTDAARGTAWGLLQTGIEYIDHFASTRKVGGKSEGEARFESAQFGGGNDLKEEMTHKIVELAGV